MRPAKIDITAPPRPGCRVSLVKQFLSPGLRSFPSLDVDGVHGLRLVYVCSCCFVATIGPKIATGKNP